MSRIVNYQDVVNQKPFSHLHPIIRQQLRKEKEFFIVFRFIVKVQEQIDDMIIKNLIRGMAMEHHGTQVEVKSEEVIVLLTDNEKEFSSLQENASKIEAQKMNMIEQYKKIRV